MNFDQKTLLPTDMPDVRLFMWTYRDAAWGSLAYGTLRALVDDFDNAAHYGDDEDHAPDKVWALTTKGPIPVSLSVSADTGNMVRVAVKWLVFPGDGTRSQLVKDQAWYPVRDI